MIGKGKTRIGTQQLLSYIMKDDKGPKHQPAPIIKLNDVYGSSRMIAKQFGEIQDFNNRAHHNNLHYILSPVKGEWDGLSKEKKLEIVERFAELSGIQDQQYVAVEHQDTDITHVHLAVNRIRYDGTCLNSSFISNKAAKHAEQVAREFGLTTAREVQQAQRLKGKELKNEILNIHIGIMAGKPSMQEWLERMNEQGALVQLKPSRKEGVAYDGYRIEYKHQSFKSSEINKSISLNNLMPIFAKNEGRALVSQIALPQVKEKPGFPTGIITKIYKKVRNGLERSENARALTIEKLGYEELTIKETPGAYHPVEVAFKGVKGKNHQIPGIIKREMGELFRAKLTQEEKMQIDDLIYQSKSGEYTAEQLGQYIKAETGYELRTNEEGYFYLERGAKTYPVEKLGDRDDQQALLQVRLVSAIKKIKEENPYLEGKLLEDALEKIGIHPVKGGYELAQGFLETEIGKEVVVETIAISSEQATLELSKSEKIILETVFLVAKLQDWSVQDFARSVKQELGYDLVQDEVGQFYLGHNGKIYDLEGRATDQEKEILDSLRYHEAIRAIRGVNPRISDQELSDALNERLGMSPRIKEKDGSMEPPKEPMERQTQELNLSDENEPKEETKAQQLSLEFSEPGENSTSQFNQPRESEVKEETRSSELPNDSSKENSIDPKTTGSEPKESDLKKEVLRIFKSELYKRPEDPKELIPALEEQGITFLTSQNKQKKAEEPKQYFIQFKGKHWRVEEVHPAFHPKNLTTILLYNQRLRAFKTIEKQVRLEVLQLKQPTLIAYKNKLSEKGIEIKPLTGVNEPFELKYQGKKIAFNDLPKGLKEDIGSLYKASQNELDSIRIVLKSEYLKLPEGADLNTLVLQLKSKNPGFRTLIENNIDGVAVLSLKDGRKIPIAQEIGRIEENLKSLPKEKVLDLPRMMRTYIDQGTPREKLMRAINQEIKNMGYTDRVVFNKSSNKIVLIAYSKGPKRDMTSIVSQDKDSLGILKFLNGQQPKRERGKDHGFGID